MSSAGLTDTALKQVFKEALAETLVEQRELLAEVVVQVIEDMALGEAIRQGQQSDDVPRDAIMEILEEPR